MIKKLTALSLVAFGLAACEPHDAMMDDGKKGGDAMMSDSMMSDGDAMMSDGDSMKADGDAMMSDG